MTRVGPAGRGDGRSHAPASIPMARRPTAGRHRYNRRPMVRSLWRTLMGPSRDPRMASISRPLPRDLPDAQVVEALDRALAVNPDPAYLVETLPAALREVTGREFEVLDRSVQDVTGTHLRRTVMIRDGDVGHWPGYDAMRYSLLASPRDAAAARAALAEPPARMPGWEPRPPAGADAPGRADLELEARTPDATEGPPAAGAGAAAPAEPHPRA